MDIKISPGIWSHNDFQLAAPTAKLGCLYLLTNTRVNFVGYAEISDRYFTFETGLNKEALIEAFEALPKGFVKNGNGYWVRGFIEWQFGRGQSLVRSNMVKALLRAMGGLRSSWVIDEILQEYPELRPLWKSAGKVKPLASPSGEGQGQEQSRVEKSKSREEQSRVEGGAGGNLHDGRRPETREICQEHLLALGATEDVVNEFFNHYEANGWKQGGRTPLVSWQAAAAKWVGKWRKEEKKSTDILPPPQGYDATQPHATTGGVEVAN